MANESNGAGPALVTAAAILVTGGLFVLALRQWLATPASPPLAERIPTAHDRVTAAGPEVDLRGRFAAFDGQPGPAGAAWPRFRGADFDNVSKDSPALANAWPEGGPPERWRIPLGDGHAGPAVRNGRVYVLDYDEERQEDALRCFSLADGREVWRRAYKVRVKRNHGMSRTVPAVTDHFVVSIGPRGHVLCARADSGDFLWGLDLVREYGTKEPLWYTAQCPLIDDGLAILAPAGKVLMMAVDCATGATRWETPNPRGWEMSHSSIMPMTFGGRRMFVYAAIGGIAGVAADGPDAGRILWESDAWNHSVVSPSPVVLDGGRLFLTAGYGVGSLLLQLEPGGDGFAARVIARLDRSVFACEQQTPIYCEDHLFGILPKDAGALKTQLACFDPAGHNVWTSGKSVRFGLGPYLVADGKLFVLNDDGVLTMARAWTDGYVELARARILDGRDAWGPMAIVDGWLLLRDSTTLVCLDVRAP